MSDAIDDLARAVLDEEGQRRFEQLRNDVRQGSRSAWAERYPALGEQFEEKDPSVGDMLVAVGLESRTVGWVDWAREDDEHQVRDMTVQACQRLGLPDPGIPETVSEEVLAGLGDDAKRGDFVPAVLQTIDARLRAVGSRLLMIELNSDEYNFAPVTSRVFETLVGRGGDGFRLYDTTRALE